MFSSRSVIAATCVLCLLSACGGGGGGSGNGGGGSPVQTNPLPTIAAQVFSGSEDQPLSGTIVANDPGDSLSFAVIAAPANGTLTAIGNGGAFTYTPTENFAGEDQFQVQVRDSAGQPASATITLRLMAVNDAPEASNDILSVDSATGLDVLLNDVDADGDALTVELIGNPVVGTAVVTPDGKVNVALPAGFKGFTKFDYRITDVEGVFSEASAQVFVGIAPFRLVYLGTPLSGGEFGLYVHDFFGDTKLDPLTTGFYEKIRSAENGSALALEVIADSGQQIWYVDLDDPDDRAHISAELSAAQYVEDFALSPDGRHVALIVRTPMYPADHRELYVYSRATGETERMGLPVTDHLSVSIPRFDTAASAVYYIAYSNFPGSSAVFKTELSSGATSRVSPLFSGAGGFNYVHWWLAPDESRLVHMRSHDGTYSLWVNDSASPDVEARLHEPFQPPETAFYPIISPDGLKVAFANSQVRLASTLAPGVTEGIGPSQFQESIDRTSFHSNARFRPDSAAVLTSSCNYEAGGYCNLYEVSLTSLSAPQRVNPPLSGQESIISGVYSADGERISYDINGIGSRQLLTTRRSMLGVEATALSSETAYLNFHMFDPSGTVALVLATEQLQASPLYLVNVDAPDVRIPLVSAGGFAELDRVLPRQLPTAQSAR